MTFSIVARDPQSGDLGVGVASKFLAVGSVVPHARAGIGAIATQALANYTYGADGLHLLRRGMGAQQALENLVGADEGRDHRQLGIVDANGDAATYTGSGCIDWAGGRTAQGVAAQGNLLAGAKVVDALIDTYIEGGLPFPELLLESLRAADDAGGDRRGRQSCALLVVRENGGYGGNNDRMLDLRVDDSDNPIEGVAQLLALYHLYGDRPKADDLLPIDDALAAELQRLLENAGYTPATTTRGSGLAALLDSLGVERTGEPRPTPDAWDDAWQGAMSEWMSVENLEERMTARGWLDPRVLDHLRARAG